MRACQVWSDGLAHLLLKLAQLICQHWTLYSGDTTISDTAVNWQCRNVSMARHVWCAAQRLTPFSCLYAVVQELRCQQSSRGLSPRQDSACRPLLVLQAMLLQEGSSLLLHQTAGHGVVQGKSRGVQS